MKLEILSFKVSPELAERLRREAARRNLPEKYTKSDLVRDILDANLPPLRQEVEAE